MKVLVVDDDLTFCSLIQQQLRKYDVEVVTASSTTQALKILSCEEFPVVISDIKMETPVAGISFLEQAGRINPKMGRLILTGYDRDLEWVRQTPGIWRLQKPHNIQDVLIAILRLSESPSLGGTDLILDEIITKIKDTNIDTSKIEEKLNKLLSNGLLNKIEHGLENIESKMEYIEKDVSVHESKRQKMEDIFIAKVDNTKFLLKLISIIGGVILTIFGLILKCYLLK